MNDLDKTRLNEFLDSVSNLLRAIIYKPVSPIPLRLRGHFSDAWEEVQPLFERLKAGVSQLSERDAEQFDSRGLSGVELSLKLAVYDAAFSMLKKKDRVMQRARLSSCVKGALMGGFVGLAVSDSLWKVFSFLFGLDYWNNTSFPSQEIFTSYVSTLIGGVAGWFRNGAKAAAKIFRGLHDPVLKGANVLLGSMSVAMAAVPMVGPALSGYTEKIKEVKEAIETAIKIADQEDTDLRPVNRLAKHSKTDE